MQSAHFPSLWAGEEPAFLFSGEKPAWELLGGFFLNRLNLSHVAFECKKAGRKHALHLMVFLFLLEIYFSSLSLCFPLGFLFDFLAIFFELDELSFSEV